MKKIKDLKFSIVHCLCGKDMKMVEQTHHQNNMLHLKYKCDCGKSASMLVTPDGEFFKYIYNSDGSLARFDNGKLENYSGN